MMRHLARLVWNRRRQNLLIAFEVLLAFLVLFGVVLIGAHHAWNWRQPLGFDVEHVWSVNVMRGMPDPAADARAQAVFRDMLDEIDRLPNVERSAGAFTLPYYGSGWGSGIELADGRMIEFQVNHVMDDFLEVVRPRLIAGRWFSRDDDAAAWMPVVINQRLAEEIFGDRDPIHQLVAVKAGDEIMRGGVPRPRRVVGVVEEFRKDGEFSSPGNFLFYRMRVDETEIESGGPFGPPNVLALRVAPGTTAGFEETLVDTMRAVAPDWSFEVHPVADLRAVLVRDRLSQLAILGTMAVFLLVMVAMGLTGVVWQNVTRRTEEFGLRRATGASGQDVRRQVTGELLLLTSLAVLVGTALIAQVPVLPLTTLDVPIPPPGLWVASVAASVGVIYGLTLLCAWYPSRLATRMQPAEALRHE